MNRADRAAVAVADAVAVIVTADTELKRGWKREDGRAKEGFKYKIPR